VSCGLLTVSASSDSEMVIDDIVRKATGEAYPSGSVTVTLQVFDPTGLTAIGSVITATFDVSANAFTAVIPPVSNVFALAVIRVTVVASGRTRVQEYDVTVAS